MASDVMSSDFRLKLFPPTFRVSLALVPSAVADGKRTSLPIFSHFSPSKIFCLMVERDILHVPAIADAKVAILSIVYFDFPLIFAHCGMVCSL